MVAKIAGRSWRSRLTSCVWLVCAMLIAVAVRATPVNAQGTPQAADPPPLSKEQLEQVVAPIALYPDDLLSQVLMASTYPLEVVSAARWASQNPNVTGKALEDAMAKQPWDPSVKGLVAVPQTLAMMSEKLDWLQQLGDAFLDDQGAVLDAVQRLRQRAEGAGNLKTSPQMKVSKVSNPGPTGQPVERIVVESAVPQTMYVPVYDPGVAYGAWPYPAYPPYYYQPPGWVPGTFAYGAMAFGASVAVGAAIWGGANWWGGGGGNVNINANRYNSFNRTNISGGNWNHAAAHRGNVPYRNNATAQKFGGQSGAANRARGQGGQGLGQGAGAGKGGLGGQGGKQGLGGQGGGAGKGAGAGQKGGGQKGAGAGQKGGGNKMAGKGGGQGKGAGAGNRGGGGGNKMAKGGGGGGGNVGRGGGGGPRMGGGGGGHRAAMGGGGMRGGGGGMGGRGGGGMRAGGGGGRGGGGRGGGRRSDISVKHDIAFLGRLDNGLGLYRFSYNGSDRRYVGVMAQEVQFVRPDAVSRDEEGILRVDYDRLGIRFQTYDQWLGSGARVPGSVRAH